MTIIWDDPDKRYYQHGLDRGVLYISTLTSPVPWNGLISVDEGGEGTQEILYRDGVVYLSDAEPGDFVASIKSIMYPDAFSECIGIPKATDGLYVDNQKPTQFDLSYRSLIGSGSRGDMFGYQIHLVYNCMATIGQRSRNTIGDDTTPVEFQFDIVCSPVKLPGYRPTAHYIIDTRNMSASILAQVEGILYGVGATPGRMPTPTELFDLMNFGDAIKVTSYSDGTFTVEGSADNVFETDIDHFQINNINSTAPDGAGHYVISTGGTTTVVTG
jgi:hypothetical protein